jgi:hypothetical protein
MRIVERPPLPYNKELSQRIELTKKQIKFSSYIRKFRWDQLQSHI